MNESPKGWNAFAEYAKQRPPDKALQEAITLVREKGVALDMGAGALNETAYLLKEGFRKVVALDAEPGIVERAKDVEGNEHLEVVVSRFEDYAFPNATFDIVNARFSLPFMSPKSFEEVFPKIKEPLKPGGILMGQLFGGNDCRNKRVDMTTHSLAEVERLLSDMEIFELHEEEYDGPTYRDGTQHWHVFNVLARKK